MLLAALAFTVAAGVCAAAFELPEGTVLSYDLNVRRRADIDSDTFYKLKQGQRVKIKAINDQWYKVQLPEGKEGYVYYKYLDVKVFARVVEPQMQVRSQPDWNAGAIADMRGYQWIRVTNQAQNWYQVEFNSRTRGWVPKSSLEAPREFFEAWLLFQHGAPQGEIDSARSRMAPESSQPRQAARFVDRSTPPPTRNDYVPATSRRGQIIEFAKKYMGTPYVWGGESLSEGGFDCSGFTFFVYKNFGINLERVSNKQADQGTFVPNAQLMPGDLVFFDTSGSNDGNVGHAGIYIGGGNFIHASSSYEDGRYVRISNLDSGYYREKFVTGKRFFN